MPKNPKNIQALYQAASQAFDLGTPQDFDKRMDDPANRQAFYNTVGKKVDLGDYDSFNKNLGYDSKEVQALNQPIDYSKNISDIRSQQNQLNADIEGQKKMRQSEQMAPGFVPLADQKPFEEQTAKRQSELQSNIDNTAKGIGVDPKDFAEIINAAPAITSPSDIKQLAQIKGENQQKYDRTIAATNWQNDLYSAIKQKDPQNADAVIAAIHNSQLDPNADYNTVRNTTKNLIDAVHKYVDGSDAQDKIINNIKIDKANSYGGTVWGTENVLDTDPRKQFGLNNNQLLALNYEEDIDPDKAAKYKKILIDKNILSDSEKLGYENTLRELDTKGADLRLTKYAETINDLRAKGQKQGGALSQQDLDELNNNKAGYDAIVQYKNDLYNGVNPAYKKANQWDNFTLAQDLVGQHSSGVNRFLLKAGEATGNTIEGMKKIMPAMIMYNLISGNGADNAKAQLDALGEEQKNEAVTHLAPGNQTENAYEIKTTPEFDTELKKIKNDKTLSGDEKIARTQQLIQQMPGGAYKKPIDPKMNFSGGAILNSLGDMTASLLPFLAIEGVGELAGTPKVLNTLTSVMATGFQQNYANAVANGSPNPYLKALQTTGVQAAFFAGVDAPGAIKKVFGDASAIGSSLKGLTDDEINALLTKKSPALKAFFNTIKEANKTSLKLGAANTGAAVTNSLLNGQKIDPQELAKQFGVDYLKNMLLFSTVGSAKGLISGEYKNAQDPDKLMLFNAVANPNEFANTVHERVINGDLTQEQGAQILHNVADAKEIYDNTEFVDGKGNPLSDKDARNVLWNNVKAAQIEGTLKKILPKKVEENLNIELAKTEADNDLIHEPKTDKSLTAEKARIEKQLEAKKDNGEPELNEKDRIAAKGRLAAIDERLAKPKIRITADKAEEINKQQLAEKNTPKTDTNEEDINSNAKTEGQEGLLNTPVSEGAAPQEPASSLNDKKEDIERRRNEELSLVKGKKLAKINTETSDGFTNNGLQVHFSVHNTSDELGSYVTIRAKSKDGKNYGYAKFIDRGDGNLEGSEVEVSPKYQKQGVASAIYSFADAKGYKLKQSPLQTPEGRALWDSLLRTTDKEKTEINAKYDAELKALENENKAAELPNPQAQGGIANESVNKVEPTTAEGQPHEIKEQGANNVDAVTGIKNEVTKEERAERGLGEVEVEVRRSFGDVFEKAKKAVDDGTIDARKLAADLAKTPRALNAEESAALIYDRMKLYNEHAKVTDLLKEAYKSGDKAAQLENSVRIAKIEDDINTNDLAARKTGYEQGLGLAARKMMIREDYTLANQIQQYRNANGGEDIPQEVRQKLEAMTIELEKANKKLEQYEEQIKRLKAEKNIPKTGGKNKKSNTDFKKERDSIFDKIKEKWNNAGKDNTLTAVPVPYAKQLAAIAPDVMKLVKSYAEQGIVKLSDIVDDIHTNLLKSIPEITKKDVVDILAGEHTEVKTKTIDPVRMKLQANVEKIKDQIDVEKYNIRQAKRNRLEKGLDWFAKFRRAVILSSVTTIGKLAAAASYRQGTNFVEDVIGGGLSKIPGISNISKGAPREGGLNIKAEAKSLSQWWQKATYEDVANIVKHGKGELDYLYGKKKDMPKSVLDFFGHIHGALKAPAKRAEFFRSFEKRAEYYAKQGEDISDPVVQSKIAAESYIDANRAIFMQDNIISDAYRNAINYLEHTGTKGKITATMMKVLMPIVKIPTNFVAETSSYAVGGLKAATSLVYHSLKNGFDNLTHDQKDYIIRNLKKQSLGAAMFAMGYFNPNLVGGYYTGKRKEGDLDAGDFTIGGVKMPHWMLHAPFLEVMQMGATFRRVQDEYADKGKGGGNLAALGETTKGLVEETPMMQEMTGISKATENESGFNKFMGGLATSIVVPPDLQKIARNNDTDTEGNPIKRETATVKDAFKAATPGLRETLPKAPIRTISKTDQTKPIWKFVTDKGADIPSVNLKQLKIQKDGKEVSLMAGLTEAEKDNFVKLRQQKIEDKIKILLDKGAYVQVGDNMVVKQAKDISKDQLNKLMKGFSAEATKDAKTELFGDQTPDTEEVILNE